MMIIQLTTLVFVLATFNLYLIKSNIDKVQESKVLKHNNEELHEANKILKATIKLQEWQYTKD